VVRKNRKDKHIQMSIKLIISHREALPVSRLRKQLNHQVHNEHKERGVTWLVFFVSFVNFVVKPNCVPRTKPALSPLWFSQTKCCELLFETGQGVTNRAKQPAGHHRFLPLMATFGPKKCAPPVRTSHKWRTSICDFLFLQTRPVSRNIHNTCEKNTCDL
jgi:hypothetical protein